MELDNVQGPPLSTQNVSAAYGKKQVLHDISLTVNNGEIFGLVGLNGAGKTTLIRSILGLRECRGEISLFSRSNTDASARRALTYLPERLHPSPQLKGFEYLSILLDYFDQALDKGLARDMARRLDLDPAALEARVRTYSKGMGQKLGLIGSFLVNAPLMILDEPMSGLDPRARVFLKDQLLAARTAGRAIFFSSHILADIEEICSRIGILHAGKIIFTGTPNDFISQYGSPSLERAFLAAIEQTDRAASA